MIRSTASISTVPGTPAGLCLLFVAAAATAGDLPDPCTRLFDTGAPAAERIASDRLPAESARWKQVRENDAAHSFAGDAAVRNNRLLVLFRRNASGPEIYTVESGGTTFRAALEIAARRNAPAAPFGPVRIVENTSGGVALAARSAGGGPVFALTAGEARLEVRGAPGASFLRVAAPMRCIAVPDYFGDDMVFDALHGAPGPLPAENACLAFLAGGDALMMCTWRPGGAYPWFRPAGDPRRPSTLVADLGANRRVWFTFLVHPGIWRLADSAGAGAWTPPFPAKWRRSLMRHDGAARSRPAPLPPGSPAPPGPAVIYPIDRTRQTPFSVSCVTDALRNTLGVGPCQYILSVEGLSADGGLTPDSVMDWIERQFRRKRQRKAAAAVRERLARMVEHVEHARDNIRRYRAFADSARAALRRRPGWERFAPVLNDLRRFADSGLAPAAAPERAGRLAAAVTALLDRPDAANDCRRLGDQLRELGARQDRALARCRMAVRRLKRQALLARAAGTPDVAESARVALRLAETMLGTKRTR